jgi:hypothetical protein
MAIELGMTVRDRITGFTGVVTGYVRYISGCNQALVVPKVKEDGSLIDPAWYDEQRLEDTGKGIMELDNGAHPGPDKPAPKR